jgi:integrase
MPKTNNGPRLAANDAGIWEIRWTEGRRSHRLSTKHADRSTAEQAFAKWIIERNAPKARHVTVKQALDAYLTEHVEQVVVDKQRQEDCARCLTAELGDKTPSELTPDVMMTYRRRREQGKVNGHPVGSGTLRRELNCLVAAFNHAIRHRRMAQSEMPHIDLPSPPPPKDIWLDETEAEQLWQAAERLGGRGFLFTALALETASRKKAIEQLRWDQVDLTAGVIHFQNDGGQRTNKRRVAVPISERLAGVLSSAKAAASTEWVLVSPYSIQHAFDRVKANAYMATQNEKFMQISPHALRHTWATLASRAGVPLFQVAGVLGDSLPTVMRVYAHHSPEHLRGAVNFRSPSLPSRNA